MQRLECDVCLQDIGDYYDTTVSIIDHHQRLLSMASENPHGSKLLSSGRVVILRDRVSKRRLVKRCHRPGRWADRILPLHSTAFQIQCWGAAQTRADTSFRGIQDVLGLGSRGFTHEVREKR